MSVSAAGGNGGRGVVIVPAQTGKVLAGSPVPFLCLGDIENMLLAIDPGGAAIEGYVELFVGVYRYAGSQECRSSCIGSQGTP